MSTAASSGSPQGETGPAPRRIRVRDWPLVAARTLAVFSWTTVMATILVLARLPAILRPGSGAVARARARRWVKRTWGRGVLRTMGVRVAAEGRPPPAGALVVSNHLGYLDIPVLDSVAPMVFVARADLRRWPFWGLMASLAGTIYVDRATKRDVLRVRNEMGDAMARGENVVVFPEATSTAGDTMLPFKPALLADAAAHGSPVYWLTLSYSTPPGGPTARDRVCWWGDMTFAPHVLGLFALRRVDCTIRFGAAPVRLGDRKAMALELRRRMLAGFEPVDGRTPRRGSAR
ncbi:MAG: lysophospholipid acyltransferase family protein [Gemmatimonadota bacterium]|nr:lysophospholipid acyltransferase family protein [Gemmatimonadota bacterium]MDE2871438.1 lysophospholipid acyltransferase family protein [Gemmatimonadota bacterium]